MAVKRLYCLRLPKVSGTFDLLGGLKPALEFVHFSRRGSSVEAAVGRIQAKVGDQFGVFRHFFAQ